MMAEPTPTAQGWHPVSPALPRPDPEHDARAAQAVAYSLREIPFYQKRGGPSAPAGAFLPQLLERAPLLQKRDVRASLPKQWVPAGHDVRAELASGAIELVETSGSTGERVRVLWEQGWWMRQKARAAQTNPSVASAMGGALGRYREAVLAVPVRGLGTCHSGESAYEERVDGDRLFLNQQPDPLFWRADEQARMLDELERHETIGLESDPHYLALLARFAREHGRKITARGFVQLTYSQTTQAHLRAIREVYAGPLLQLYGARDVGTLFMENEEGRLCHAPYTTHVELLRARAATPGASAVALVVATSLDRTVMPFVRFVTGDLVQVDRDGSRRWTSVASLRTLEGRIEDAVVRPDGALVTAAAMDRALGAPPGLRDWQVNQRVPGQVEIDVVAEGDEARVASEARARLAPLFEGLEVTARPATAIPIEPSGKFRSSKRHFSVDMSRFFEGCERVTP